jgi:hypothetical protein
LSVFWLSIFERTIRIQCDAPDLQSLLLGVYGGLLLDQVGKQQEPDLDYRIYYSSDRDQQICMHRLGQTAEYAEDDGLFLYLFEKDMTIALETIRHDLYFLHAAALEYGNKLHLLVAESGGGKSTTSWALLHHGFRYASDELAPVKLDSMLVDPYPHALCLKKEPPVPYQLPVDTLYTSRTLHIPVEALPSEVVGGSLPLQSIMFVHYNPQANSPSIQPVSAAHAGARVYANGLNQLAHPGDGLDAALQIAQRCNCYALESAGLQETCQLVIEVLDKDMGI